MLLFYNKLHDKPEEIGVTINPYDPYVANKMINKSQLTITWHVDNLKVSHNDINKMTKFILDSEKMNGDDGITVKRGRVHSYFGMNFDYSTNKQLKC